MQHRFNRCTCQTTSTLAETLLTSNLQVNNLAVELGPRHIIVNTVAPGIIPSKMSAPLMDRHGGIEAVGIEAVAKQVPDQKLGTKEDLAGVMVFLASRASRHMNGATLMLDGGSYLVRGCA